MGVTRLFREFVASERAGGILLIFCTLLSLLLANSFLQSSYLGLWNFQLADHALSHWINDGLMTLFFLLIGLELERELFTGELSTLRNALLPVAAALGGMIVPAALFLSLNYGTPSQPGGGIPMATDIAFAVAILSLLGNRVPPALKIFLTALAVIDDLGAVLVIAVFYAQTISWISLGISLGIFVFLLLLNRLKVNSLIPYMLGGVAMWYFMMLSGVHPTITGVLLAFALPFGHGSKQSPSSKLQHYLHKPVAFLILPLFALANTCLQIHGDWILSLTNPGGLGILAGLAIGKPLGIFAFSYAAVALGICSLPQGVNWKQVLGIGFLGGIGFTMSIFITLLAFEEPGEVSHSKIAILIASLSSALMGYFWLKSVLRTQAE